MKERKQGNFLGWKPSLQSPGEAALRHILTSFQSTKGKDSVRKEVTDEDCGLPGLEVEGVCLLRLMFGSLENGAFRKGVLALVWILSVPRGPRHAAIQREAAESWGEGQVGNLHALGCVLNGWWDCSLEILTSQSTCSTMSSITLVPAQEQWGQQIMEWHFPNSDRRNPPSVSRLSLACVVLPENWTQGPRP